MPRILGGGGCAPHPTPNNAHRLLSCRGRSTSFKNVVTVSSRSLCALRTLSNLDITDAMRPTTKEKKKPLPIIVTMAHTCNTAAAVFQQALGCTGCSATAGRVCGRPLGQPQLVAAAERQNPTFSATVLLLMSPYPTVVMVV